MSRVHLDAVAGRLIGDERLGFPLGRRVSMLSALVYLTEVEGATDDDLRKFGLTTSTVEALLVHLRCAIDAIEAEQRNPKLRLKLAQAPKVSRRKKARANV